MMEVTGKNEVRQWRDVGIFRQNDDFTRKNTQKLLPITIR
jgi:hypothetical protein